MFIHYFRLDQLICVKDYVREGKILVRIILRVTQGAKVANEVIFCMSN